MDLLKNLNVILLQLIFKIFKLKQLESKTNKILSANCTNLPFNSNTVDVIYSSHMMEHLSRDDAAIFIKECLRVLKIHNGTTDSIATSLDYKLEGRNIVTDEGTIYLIYIALITDPNEYDSYLQESISHQLAADIAYAVTNNATLANNYMTRADERLREARFIDATENSLGIVEANEFTDARL